VDDNQTECAATIRAEHPDIQVIESTTHVGPGGGRNRLMQRTTESIVASFDDDSYPIDLDYFARIAEMFSLFPKASVLCSHVYHRGEPIAQDAKMAEEVADFSGGGCAYQREIFLLAGGYVPVPVAYGMEEVDLALRLHAQDRLVLRSSWLRVFHDTDLAHHSEYRVTAASITNIVTFAYLRYPLALWPIGVWQVLNRIRYLLRKGRFRGLLAGLARIPIEPFKYRKYRGRVPAKKVWSYLKLRRRAIPMRWDGDTNLSGHCNLASAQTGLKP
jgi:hypothetical protein